MYCDHCGTRLVRDGGAKKPEKPAGATPAAPNVKPFSLPARPSGKTADLDIDGEIPDWLKTGGSQEAPTGGRKENPPPPSPSRPTPPTSGEDLPDWLNDLALPGTGPLPFRKTTDQLLSKPKEPVEANLPDWLTEWQLDEPETTSQPDVGRDAPDWLIEYPTIPEERLPAAPKPPERPAKAKPAESEVPDWLIAPAPTPPKPPPPAEDEGMPDWLHAFDLATDAESDKPKAPAGKETPSQLVGRPSAKIEPVADEGMPDWLRAFDLPAAPVEKAPAGGPAAPPKAPPPVEDDGMPDWLRSIDQPKTTQPAPAPPKAPPPVEDDGMPDWLRSIDQPKTTQPAPAPPKAPPPVEDEGMPDWLRSIDQPKTTQPAPASPKAPPPVEDDGMPDWLRSIDQPETTQPPLPAGDDTLDWLTTTTTQTQSPIEEDWLSDLFPAAAPSQQATQDEAMPDWLADQEMTSWEEPAVQQTATTNDPGDWLIELESLAPPPTTTPTIAQPSPSEEMPNWLSEMAPPTTGPLRPFEQSEAQGLEVFYTDFDALPDWLKGPEATPKEPPKPKPVAEEPEEFWALPGSSPPSENEFPDWLTAMESGQFEPQSESTTQLASSSSELPDWLHEVTGQPTFDLITPPPPETEKLSLDMSPSLPGSAELQGIPKQLAGDSLPDWLNPNPLGGPLERPAETIEVPDWLRPAKPGAFDTLITPEEPTVLPTSGEWNNLLGELPAAVALPAVSIRKGEIPEWLEALKPSEAIVPTAQKTEEPEQTVGPLAGMRGVIEIEPIIAKPVASRPVPRLEISSEQEKQVALLRQLTQGETSRPVIVAQQKTTTLTATPRLLLSLLLVGVILLGLLMPNLLPVPLPAGEQVIPIQQTLSAVAGQPVLVAFDYLPAFNGELGPQADLLLTQLAANNSPVIWVSQTPAGLALAQQATSTLAGHSLGLLPGEAAGLRNLATCLTTPQTCQTSYDEQTRQSLNDIKLIILLTSERDSLVNWIEQVHTPTNIPVLAGVTQALKPVAQPYFITGQLDGLLNGLPDAAQLEQAVGQGQTLRTQYQATALAQLLAAGLLIVGNLLYLLQGLRRSRRGFGGWLKLFRPVASLGNIAMAAIIGSGASVALVGAISGTLLPQLIAKASPNGFLSFLAALFTICTLLYFQFTGRANNSGQMLQPIWHRYLASIGRGVLMVTFGALFALTLATSLALLTERFFYFINQVSNLLS